MEKENKNLQGAEMNENINAEANEAAANPAPEAGAVNGEAAAANPAPEAGAVNGEAAAANPTPEAGAANGEAAAANPTPEKRCPNCQALLTPGQLFCPECGTSLKKVCRRCGAELQEGQMFCSNCGNRVDMMPNMPNGSNGGAARSAVSSAVGSINNNMAALKKKNKYMPLIIAGVCIAVILLFFIFKGLLGGGNSFESKFSDIQQETWCTIASDGSYMTIDTNPSNIDDYYSSSAVSAVERVNRELGFSDSVMSKMRQTRALDGRQSDENDKYKVSWTYHPDQGLEVTYEKKK